MHSSASILMRCHRHRMVALALLLSVSGCGEHETSAPRPPDVLLVTLDTVRADRTSAYGYARPTTPQLEEVARAGVLFEDVTAPASWTWPSHASLFTGTPPWVHGARQAGTRPDGAARSAFGIEVMPLRSDLPTLAERFTAVGYRTVSLASNEWLDPALGLMRGFEVVRTFEHDAQVIASAIAEIEASQSRPLLLFINLMTAHAPYYSGPGPWAAAQEDWLTRPNAPGWMRDYLVHDGSIRGVNLSQTLEGDRFSGVVRYLTGKLEIPEAGFAFLNQLYDAGVRAADFSFGQILAAWVKTRPDAIVAVTSDHGEGLGERGLFEHRHSVYPAVVRIPLIIAAPGRLPANRRVKTPVQLQDLYPTLLELAGIETSGASLLDVMEGKIGPRPIAAAAWPDGTLASEFGGRFARVWRLYREGEDALIFSDGGEVELFDLASDPGMQHSIAGQKPARVASLLQAAKIHFAEDLDRERNALEIPEANRERLRALGYLAN